MKGRMKHAGAVLLTLLLAGIAPVASAQQDSESTGDENVTEEAVADSDAEQNDEDAADAQEDSPEQTTVISDDDTFVPTVQISEDLSVSFPVDI